MQGRKYAGLTTHCFLFRCTRRPLTHLWRDGLRVVQRVVRQCDQRIDVENDEAYGGMCSKFCGVGRAITLLFYKGLHRDVRHV